MPSNGGDGNHEGSSGGDGSGRGYGGGGVGGGNSSLGLNNYGSLADAATGYSPTTGFVSTQVSDPGLNNYGYNGPQVSGMQLQGARSTASLDALKASLQENMPELAGLIPGVTAVTNIARFVAMANDALTPREMATFRSASGLTETDVAQAKEAVATGRESEFGVVRGGGGGGGGGGGNLLGFTAGAGSIAASTGATAPAATNELDDIFAHFGAGGTSTTPTFQMPEYDADPTGMIAGGSQFMTDYQRDYAPYAAKMRAEVDRIGTPEYLQQQRGMAMADVQSQYDSTMQQNQRGLARMGVNPSSGRMMAMQNQGAIQNAASKVGAAAKAEGMVKTNYLAGLGAVNTMGTDVAKMGQGWAGLGNDAAKTNMAWGLGSAELGLKAQTQTQTNDFNWGKLAVDRYGIDKGVQKTQMTNDAQAEQNTNDNLWTVGTAVLGSVLNPSKTKAWYEE